MGQLARAVEYGNEFMKNHPEHKEQVRDYFQLMKDEIEEGSSVDMEIEHFIAACDDLLNDDDN
jgi:hypothetical protein